MKAVKRFLRWLWEFIKSFNTTKGYIALFIAFNIMYGWVIVLFVLGTIRRDVYLIGIATTVAVFWGGPFSPFFPILVGLTRFIQKIILRDKAVPKHLKEKKDENIRRIS